MTGKKLLENNGNFKQSPLLEVVKRLDLLLSGMNIPYAVIVGLGVIRNGAFRTTMDVDILVSREDWEECRDSKALDSDMEVHGDWARDRKFGINLDIIFTGNSWEMVIPYPIPERVREWDEELLAWFVGLMPLLEIKTAVYLKKCGEDGPEIAAKDLADIVALIQNNRDRINEESIKEIHPAVRPELLRIYCSTVKRKADR